MSGQPQTYDLHQLHDALLVKPGTTDPVHFVVVTAKGPRHMDVDALRELLSIEAPEGITEQTVEQILTRNIQAIREQVDSKPKPIPEPVQLDLEQLPVVAPYVLPEIPVVGPKDARVVTGTVKAEGDALGFIRDIDLNQGVADYKSRYWEELPAETDRPEPLPPGSTVAQHKAYERQCEAWVARREAEIAHWRIANNLVRPDGTHADAAPSYALNLAAIKAVARSHGLPVDENSESTSDVLVPILLQSIKQLQDFIQSPEYFAQAVAHFHESLRQTPAAESE
ncbi:hypothetical protein [Stenotrophomonas sp. GD03657]|uniref:hypothetical protein n=1 Tax=Stenotrophomonas sp. GD03657 TaxID=2975363 RepID=UPI0024473DD1|nr:hypothetical protein [Stenotrophomonas sp. GD03657]MDH2154232.1 hypothetical protein [Stenotrophomonas sp. GD03657]